MRGDPHVGLRRLGERADQLEGGFSSSARPTPMCADCGDGDSLRGGPRFSLVEEVAAAAAAAAAAAEREKDGPSPMDWEYAWRTR